jgi:hypothetical protein
MHKHHTIKSYWGSRSESARTDNFVSGQAVTITARRLPPVPNGQEAASTTGPAWTSKLKKYRIPYRESKPCQPATLLPELICLAAMYYSPYHI